MVLVDPPLEATQTVENKGMPLEIYEALHNNII